MVSLPSLVGLALLLGLVLVYATLRLVNRQHLLAQVNERSSHVVPTPTMGGVAIVLVCLGYLLVPVFYVPGITLPLALALGSVAFVGLVDDLRPMSRRLRMLVHLFSAGFALYALQGSSEIPWWQMGLAWFAVVWFLNLYNFMDGIDGMAAVQSLTFVVGVMLLSGGVPGWAGELLWVFAGASLAFLGFNWPPARIFMGDVGSGFSGLLIGLFAIYLAWQEILPLIANLILLAGFWFDATYTLCVRMFSGQPFTQAHRSHLYQRLAQRRGHLWTTTGYLLVNLCWFLPLAYTSTQFPNLALLSLLIAVLPMAFLCYLFRAGYPEAAYPGTDRHDDESADEND